MTTKSLAISAILALLVFECEDVAANFIRFGALFGDKNTLSHNRSSEIVVESRIGFRFGGSSYNTLYIGNHGTVSFGSPLAPCCSEWNPTVSGHPTPFIAPLWTGEREGYDPLVYYRSSLEGSDLETVRLELLKGYGLQSFNPELSLVVTWTDLPCYNVNVTVQLALVTDYFSTYAVVIRERHDEYSDPSFSAAFGASCWAGISYGHEGYFSFSSKDTGISSTVSHPGANATTITSVYKLSENPVEATNVGRDFYFAFSMAERQIPNIAIFIVPTSRAEPLTVEVTALGTALSRKVELANGVGEVVSLYDLDTEKLMLSSSFKSNGGVRVRVVQGSTEATVSVSVVSDVPYQSSGFLVPSVDGANYIQFPNSLLKYVALMYSHEAEQFSFMIIVAQYDNTVVEVTPTQPVLIGYSRVTFPGKTKTLSLNRQETLVIQSSADLTGSVVTTWGGKPIAFFSGHTSTEIPVGIKHSDFIGESVPPVNQWGRCYVTAPHLPRTGFELLRVLSAFDRTRVNVQCWSLEEGGHFIDISVTLSEGEFWDSGVEALGSSAQSSSTLVTSAHYCKVSADKPVLLAQFTVGAFSDFSSKGNPSMVIVPPTDAYSNLFTVSPARDSWNVFTDYVNLFTSAADYQPDLIRVGNTPLSLLDHDVMGIPPDSPEYYAVRFAVPGGLKSLTVRHSNPMARLGGVVYGVASFTAYSYTAAVRKEQDIIVLTEDGHLVPNNGYTASEPPTTLICRVDPNIYATGNVTWLLPSGQPVPRGGGGFVYQKQAGLQVSLHVQSKDPRFEGHYFCRAEVGGVVRQLKVGVFVTPPAPSEVSFLSASAYNSTAILLQWAHPTLPHDVSIVSYTVVNQEVGSSTFSSVDVEGGVTRHVIAGLNPDTDHTVGVYATSSAGAGPAALVSPVRTHRTSQEVQRCPSLKLTSRELQSEFAANPRYVPVLIGSTISIACACAQSVSTSAPMWHFGRTLVPQDGESPNARIYQSQNSGRTTLTVESFSVDLSGVYSCRDFNTYTEFFLLPVDSNTGAEIPFVLSPPTSYRMELGTSVSLTCSIRGEGLVGMHWETKRGRLYPTTLPGRPLVLENVGLELEDEYRCVVEASTGSVASSFATIAVYGTPTLLTNGRSDIVVNVGEKLVLTCRVAVETRAVHTPKLAWFQGEEEVVLDDLHQVSHKQIQVSDDGNSKASVIDEFQLIFTNLTSADWDVYQCRLFHRIGISHRHALFNVSVQFQPHSLQLSHSNTVLVNEYSLAQVNLRCSVAANPTPKILWVRNEVAVAIETALTLDWTIVPQDPMLAGRYTCLATNQIGLVEDGFLVERRKVNVTFEGASYLNSSIISAGSVYPVTMACFLEGITAAEVSISWHYPNGLPVGGANEEAIFQTRGSSDRNRTVESVLTWRPSSLFGGSFNGEGFFSCRVRTAYGLVDSMYLGVFIRPPVPGPPQGVKVERVVPFSLKVSWSRPMTFPVQLISHYTVRHYMMEGDNYTHVELVTVAPDQPHEHTFRDVKLGAVHTVGVAAVRGSDSGAMSVAKPIKIPREAFRGRKCDSLSVRVLSPGGYLGQHLVQVPALANVVVFCSCHEPHHLTITDPEWAFNEETLPNSNQLRRGYFRLPRTEIAVLRIKEFSLDDVGTYSCVDFHLRGTVTLSLQGFGSSDGIPTGLFLLPQLLVSAPGYPIQLPCTVEGDTLLGNLTWSTSGVRGIPPSDPSSLLFFGSFQRPNIGSYVCRQESSFGVRFSHRVAMQIYDKPTLVEGEAPAAEEFGEGKSIVLRCAVRNDPLALDTGRVVWSKDAQRIVPNNRKTRILNPGENPQRIAYSTLQVTDAERSDEGVYSCSVRNAMGSVARSIAVTVHPGPTNLVLSPPGPLSAVLSEGLNITCSAQGTPAPSVQWRRNSIVLVSGSGTASYAVASSDHSDDGIYSCTAENKFGRLDRSLRVQVVDVCASRGLRCSDACRRVNAEWQCVCRAGSVLVNRRTLCKNCGRIPFRQPPESFDPSTVPGIGQIPQSIFRLNYYTHPWTVALCDRETSRMFCGGVLISNEWILTLGSCVCGRGDFRGVSAVFLDPFTVAHISGGVVAASANCLDYPALSSQALQIQCGPASGSGGGVQDDSVALVRIQSVDVQPACLPSNPEPPSPPPTTALTTQYFPNLIGGLVRTQSVSYKTQAEECSQAFSPSGKLMCIESTRSPCNRVGGTAIVSSEDSHQVVTGLLNGHSSECTYHAPYEKHVSLYPYIGWIRNTTSLHGYLV